jgi:hypothetical protein
MVTTTAGVDAVHVGAAFCGALPAATYSVT